MITWRSYLLSCLFIILLFKSFIGSVLLFNMANYTFRVCADMMLLHGKVRRMEGLLVSFMRSVFQTPSHALFAKVYQRSFGDG